jgi:hypothetical protein
VLTTRIPLCRAGVLAFVAAASFMACKSQPSAVLPVPVMAGRPSGLGALPARDSVTVTVFRTDTLRMQARTDTMAVARRDPVMTAVRARAPQVLTTVASPPRPVMSTIVSTRLGKVRLTAPRAMVAYRHYIATVSMIRDTSKDAFANAPAGNATAERAQAVGEQMRATLTGDGFRIEAKTDSNQTVGTDSQTDWPFDVEPVRSGSDLTLVAHIVERIDATDTRNRDSDPLSINVQSNVVGAAGDIWQTNKSALLAWLLPTGGFGGVLTWLVGRKGSAKKNA